MVKNRLIRLGSCRSTIELRPRNQIVSYHFKMNWQEFDRDSANVWAIRANHASLGNLLACGNTSPRLSQKSSWPSRRMTQCARWVGCFGCSFLRHQWLPLNSCTILRGQGSGEYLAWQGLKAANIGDGWRLSPGSPDDCHSSIEALKFSALGDASGRKYHREASTTLTGRIRADG